MSCEGDEHCQEAWGLWESDLPKAAICIELWKDFGTGQLCQCLIHFGEWVDFPQHAPVEWFEVDTDSAFFGMTTIPAHHGVGSVTLEIMPASSIYHSSAATRDCRGRATLRGVKRANGLASGFSWILNSPHNVSKPLKTLGNFLSQWVGCGTMKAGWRVFFPSWVRWQQNCPSTSKWCWAGSKSSLRISSSSVCRHCKLWADGHVGAQCWEACSTSNQKKTYVSTWPVAIWWQR